MIPVKSDEGGVMKPGDWARSKQGGKLYLCVNTDFILGGSASFLNNDLRLLSFAVVGKYALEPTTPTPEELTQWREALAKVGLALLEEGLEVKRERTVNPYSPRKIKPFPDSDTECIEGTLYSGYEERAWQEGYDASIKHITDRIEEKP